jgi:hypothetical protein
MFAITSSDAGAGLELSHTTRLGCDQAAHSHGLGVPGFPKAIQIFGSLL